MWLPSTFPGVSLLMGLGAARTITGRDGENRKLTFEHLPMCREGANLFTHAGFSR